METQNGSRAMIKWSLIALAGAACLTAALFCYLRQYYTWVLAAAFGGCFLLTSGLKKIRLLKTARRALLAGKNSVTIFYRDQNLKEFECAVIPAGSDALFFYGFAPGKNDIRAFRWQRIIRVTESGKELNREDLLNAIKG
jgi:hypothetical protein